ncbi:type II toxin-antitoxin system HicA family toxin [Runella sp.]|uniref:type II toxin-antitoxin system HicA family toxin n=1 Tax=Runella sp. TaxID=1960881 RepID=UPI003D138A5C
MKSSEFHRLVQKNGWQLLRVSGSHYIYEKDGRTEPVPYHGSKEMGEGLRKSLTKKMGLK